ncbi:MAG: hypothetical protein JOY67_00925 [Hyphomicrobiales bacterium]|nr:hypothetical protein [Hyphomicrobiales bacterium]
MLDEARLQAGAEGASRSAPAGETQKRVRENRADLGHAFAGATGELVVTRPLSSTLITSREPRSAFLGVMLKAPAMDERRGYAIVLAAKCGHEDIVLARDLDKDEVVARWRGLAGSLGLPPLLCHANGETEFLHKQLGAVALGRHAARRRRRLAPHRRPRFLMRRKAGRAITAKA